MWEVPASAHGLCRCPAPRLAHSRAPPPGPGTQEVCAFLGPPRQRGSGTWCLGLCCRSPSSPRQCGLPVPVTPGQAAVRTRGLGSPVAVWAGGGAPPSSSPQASACTGTWTRFCQRVPWKPQPSSPPGFSQTFTLTPECTAGGGPHLPAAHSGCTGTGRRGFEGSSGSRPVSLPRQAPRGALPAAVTCSSCPCSPNRQTGAR